MKAISNPLPKNPAKSLGAVVRSEKGKEPFLSLPYKISYQNKRKKISNFWKVSKYTDRDVFDG